MSNTKLHELLVKISTTYPSAKIEVNFASLDSDGVVRYNVEVSFDNGYVSSIDSNIDNNDRTVDDMFADIVAAMELPSKVYKQKTRLQLEEKIEYTETMYPYISVTVDDDMESVKYTHKFKPNTWVTFDAHSLPVNLERYKSCVITNVLKHLEN